MRTGLKVGAAVFNACKHHICRHICCSGLAMSKESSVLSDGKFPDIGQGAHGRASSIVRAEFLCASLKLERGVSRSTGARDEHKTLPKAKPPSIEKLLARVLKAHKETPPELLTRLSLPDVRKFTV